MIVTVFRSRLKPGVREDYGALANRMNELARTMPGYISHKDFYAQDGERVAIVEFAHEEGQRAWQSNPEHRAAQKLAREKYYTEYQGLHARSRVEVQAAGASGGADLTAAR
jgi:heme-degrading monooxygenase HmoA